MYKPMISPRGLRERVCVCCGGGSLCGESRRMCPKLFRRRRARPFSARSFGAYPFPFENDRHARPLFPSTHQDDQVKLDARFFTNGVIDIVFFVDIYMQFLICFHSKGNKLITSRRIIAQRYLTGWFAPDIISCVPMDVVAIWFTSKSHKKLLRLRALAAPQKCLKV